MGDNQPDGLTPAEYMRQIYATAEQLRTISIDDLSAEDYAVLEDAVLRFYAKGIAEKALGRVVGRLRIDLERTTGELGQICQEAVRHAIQIPGRPGSGRRSAKRPAPGRRV